MAGHVGVREELAIAIFCSQIICAKPYTTLAKVSFNPRKSCDYRLSNAGAG
jgi:hypothetical protein